MTSECVNKVLVILLKLQSYDQWQVRHGGLLGLKYMLAVRKVTYDFSMDWFVCDKDLRHERVETLLTSTR